MFDIGFTELLFIGVVALIVVGPQDLPQLFRTLGRITARARALGREFTSAMNAAADESGMKDVADTLKGASNPARYGMDKLKEAADSFDKWAPEIPQKRGPEAGSAPEPEASEPETAERPSGVADDMAKIREATEKMGIDKPAPDTAKADDA